MSFRTLFSRFAVCAAAAVCAASVTASAQNSAPALSEFTNHAVWPDNNRAHISAHGGCMLKVGDTYYWYGEHRMRDRKTGVHVYSSKDLYNWKDEGLAFDAASMQTQGQGGRRNTFGINIERPKVVYNAKTGKYVLWFHLETGGNYNSAFVGCGVADTPTGPFKHLYSGRTAPGTWPADMPAGLKDYAEGKSQTYDRQFARLVDNYQSGQESRDMTVFVDDDGKAYLFCASENNLTMHIVELNDEYTGFTGRWWRILEGKSYEAPVVFRHDGKYYLLGSHCTGWTPNPGRAAVADKLTGPWRELGNFAVGEGADRTYEGQTAHSFAVQGEDGKEMRIVMLDSWKPQNLMTSQYIWLPLEWNGEKPVAKYQRTWKLPAQFAPRPAAAKNEGGSPFSVFKPGVPVQIGKRTFLIDRRESVDGEERIYGVSVSSQEQDGGTRRIQAPRGKLAVDSAGQKLIVTLFDASVDGIDRDGKRLPEGRVFSESIELNIPFAQLPVADDGQTAGYLFAHFRGERSNEWEQIFFAISKDGAKWQPLNDGKSVLQSNLGEGGVRDPYVVRNPDDGAIYLIATDLCIGRNGDWGRAQRAGSKAIIVWESKDMVNWSEPRRVEVAVPNAGCTWAPEAFWDADRKEFFVFWASRETLNGSNRQRIYSARTKDFRTFTPAKLYIEKPNDIIDTDIVSEGGKLYRFSKDETQKSIILEVSDTLEGEWTPVPGFPVKNFVGYEGPECFRMADGRWCMIIDYYSRGQGYKAFFCDDLSKGDFAPSERGLEFPYRFRHGGVITLSQTEYDALMAKWGAGLPKE